MNDDRLTAERKALRINLDSSKYGTFAEIGAGQEVARHFFQAGAAAGTVAKSISAYDMKFSDAIYGKAGRYVSKGRIMQMLEHEYGLLEERLRETRGDDATFFVFANTVSALNYRADNECHGWMAVRFQTSPHSPPHDVFVHVRMLDRQNRLQQEALGIFGVNLIYGVFHLRDDPNQFIQSLSDDLGHTRIEVDMIEFNGPEFEGVDNRILSLKLVESGIAQAVMFDKSGQVEQPADTLYKKSCLVERGSFRPLTKVNLDMLEKAKAQFVSRPDVEADNVQVFMELTLHKLECEGELDYQDFLARVDVINACGHDVLVSSYFEYYKLSAFLRRYVTQPIGIVMGINNLLDIFKTKYYDSLEGGILEAFGILFKENLKLYAYPIERSSFERYRQLDEEEEQAEIETDADGLLTTDNLRVDDHVRNLYKYVRENGFLEPIHDCDRANMDLFSRDVIEMIREGREGWEEMVPPAVAQIVKARGLWGCQR
ncbi:MAG: nicotinate-nucleotide adenylyltransferase [Opitutae bacterium]|nr:nicotinate-nucleotide adenylyltransferase [Opitutae bacterium]|tara:strand:- start:722 stop:2179 length:1458 start_codon:yes stop_codon:yes gene_type:complete